MVKLNSTNIEDMSSTAFMIEVGYSRYLKFSWIKLHSVAYAIRRLYYNYLV